MSGNLPDFSSSSRFRESPGGVDGAVCDVSGTSTATSRRARFGSLVVRRIGLSGGSSGTSSLARYGRTAFITAAATA